MKHTRAQALATLSIVTALWLGGPAIAQSDAQPRPSSPRDPKPVPPADAGEPDRVQDPRPEPQVDSQPSLAPDIRSRLEALVPSRPDLYYELGEEISDLASDPRAVELARHLYVLAFHLDRARGGQQLAAQACLALAGQTGNERDRRWLLALADVLDRRYARPEWIRRADDAVSSQEGYNAAVVLGLLRSGEGHIARKRLAEPGVSPTLAAFERLLSPTGDTGAMRWIEREVGRWPCPECHNQRIVKKGGGKDTIVKLCITCGGNPGPKLDNTALVTHLRFESQLLHGIQRSWSAQGWSDRGAPLRDPDPENLAKQFDVDPERTLWRNGRWVAPPSPEELPPGGRSVPISPAVDPTPIDPPSK